MKFLIIIFMNVYTTFGLKVLTSTLSIPSTISSISTLLGTSVQT